MNLLLMADKDVGMDISSWIFQEYPQDVALVVVMTQNDIWDAAKNSGIPCVVYDSASQIEKLVGEFDVPIDMGVTAWWPTLIKEPLLNKPKHGFINTHPSLLPYNRGKHYNFWALVEQVPFGVSLHMLDNGVDSGDIIAQKCLAYNWEDNGETLYHAAKNAMVQLFRDTYPKLRKGEFTQIKQNLEIGSFHLASELESASEIILDKQYIARDLLNLLRARTFSGQPACWFKDEGEKYEVRIEIKRKDDE